MFNLKSVRAELVEALSGFKTKEKPFVKLSANGDETSGEAGFTLVELMVVIVIIGLLATIVAINVIPATDTARVEKAKADIATIEQALEQYRLDNLTYPAGSDGLQALLNPPASLAQPQRYRRGGYIKKLPDDPWGRAYVYTVPGRKGAFDISSLGADGQPGGESENADIYSSEL
ncbi:type II secretion system major pseudopilin GspG [Sphingobium sp. 3R8]|uniref:type II secretion system major pseudopilin GspG n=1 Tax=Sphingobium sp. 3R8 TaxID=2874921 RepID=UPI001CC9EAEB|nr:type II secretion system major pseudopilin GspG [Sphingobium sp. 3R8]MBZ9646201.1 type II secretion system major pseudopilin GspG [Sphingobium sp. 3R8]